MNDQTTGVQGWPSSPEETENDLIRYYGDRFELIGTLFLVFWFITLVGMLPAASRRSRRRRCQVRRHIPRPSHIMQTLQDRHILGLRR